MWEVFISKRFNRVIGLGIFRTISCARSDMQGPRSKRYQFRNTYLAGVPHLQNLESPLLIVLILSVGLGQRLMRLQLRSIVDRLSLRARARSSDLRVPILDLLSGPLFRELQFERHRASLCKLPMLKDLLEAPDIQTLETLHSATRSLYQLVAATRDIIFLSGSRATSAYFKLGGTLAYYRDQGEEIVDDSCWVAEACLWTPWIHMGDFEAKSVSDLLCLDADSFCETLAKTWSTQLVASAYAVEFLDTCLVLLSCAHTFFLAFQGTGFVGRFAFAKPRFCVCTHGIFLALSIPKSIMA